MADPFTIGAAVAAPVIGGLIGADQARSARRRQEALMREALAQLSGIEQPKFEDELLQFTPEMMPELVGQLQAIQEEAVDVGPTAYEQISLDPRLRQEQMKALEAFGQMADMGLTEADLSMIEEQRRASEASSQARQQSIIQEMQQRGQGGAGAELAARLKAAQMASEADAAAGRDISRQALQRKIQGAQLLAEQASGLRGQDYQEQERLAQARDVLERFKAQNLQGVRSRNVSDQRGVQAANLGERQRMADTAAQLRRQQEQHRSGLVGDRYNREVQLAQARAAALTGQSQIAGDQAARRAQLGYDLGSAVGGGFSQYAAGIEKEKDRDLQRELAEKKYGY